MMVCCDVPMNPHHQEWYTKPHDGKLRSRHLRLGHCPPLRQMQYCFKEMSEVVTTAMVFMVSYLLHDVQNVPKP